MTPSKPTVPLSIRLCECGRVGRGEGYAGARCGRYSRSNMQGSCPTRVVAVLDASLLAAVLRDPQTLAALKAALNEAYLESVDRRDRDVLDEMARASLAALTHVFQGAGLTTTDEET